MPTPLLGLLALAGAALVAQNLLMARMAATGGSTVAPLVLNSAVGLVALLVALLLQNGPSGLAAAVGGFRAWSLLPGLLGSFFVFASVTGFRELGPVSTVTVLVASQLLCGLAIEIARTGLAANVTAIVGAGLLVAGSALVLARG
ncbi:DMT family transporter [Amaricoccus sp. W119]|uniref:DMT family transporter n=1 Tax=Amaricoccus sp. W119 TaxID=3391833 RepID=UPI0039A72A7C